METRRYRYLGATVASDVPLPGLPDTADPVDIDVTFVRASACPSVDSPWKMIDPPRTAWRAPGVEGSRLRLQFSGAGGEWVDFLISERGDRVTVTLGAGVDAAEAAQLLLGSVYSCILSQRGTTCLHASVVACDGRALALVGPKGAGKSTLALACVQQGAELVADDVAALGLRDGVVTAAAGGPQLRLWADTTSALLDPGADVRPIWAQEEQRPPKRYHHVDGRAAPDDFLPLAGVWLLAPRGSGATSARDLAPTELFARLTGARHMSNFLDETAHRRDFTCLATVAATVPGREVQRPHDLSTVAAVARTILAL